MLKKILVWFLIVSTIAPIIILPEVSAEEGIPLLGEWEISGLLSLKFEPTSESFTTYQSKNSFRVEFPSGIRAKLARAVVSTGAFVYLGNDTMNATQVFADQAGIYMLELPKKGEYTLVFASVCALTSIPIIGSISTKIIQESRIEIKISYKFDYRPVIIILIVIMVAGLIGVVVYGWYIKGKRKHAEEVEAKI